MGDYFDLVADLCGMPQPKRIARELANEQLPPMLMSFMSESRRLLNQRLHDELRVRLRYATVREGLAGAGAPGATRRDSPSPSLSKPRAVDQAGGSL